MSRYYSPDFIPGHPGPGEGVVGLSLQQYALFFKRVKKMTFSGNLRGTAFSVTSNSQVAGGGIPQDESIQHLQGCLHQAIFHGSGSTILINGLADLTTSGTGASVGENEDSVKYFPAIVITVEDNSDGSNITAQNPPPSGYLPSVFAVKIVANDAILNQEYNIPVSMFYQNIVSGHPGSDIAGELVISPSEYWDFNGTLDSATGAKVN